MTKKRFLMMTKTTSNSIAVIKQTAIVLLFTGSTLLFASHTPVHKKEVATSLTEGELIKKGVSASMLQEYEEIVNKYKKNITQPQWWVTFGKQISAEDRNRLETIYNQMNKAQQDKQIVFFTDAPANSGLSGKSMMMFRVVPSVIKNFNDMFSLKVVPEIGC
jgi:hypothetical protein